MIMKLKAVYILVKEITKYKKQSNICLTKELNIRKRKTQFKVCINSWWIRVMVKQFKMILIQDIQSLIIKTLKNMLLRIIMLLKKLLI